MIISLQEMVNIRDFHVPCSQSPKRSCFMQQCQLWAGRRVWAPAYRGSVWASCYLNRLLHHHRSLVSPQVKSRGKVSECYSLMPDSWQPHELKPARLLCLWGFLRLESPGRVCISLLKGIFPGLSSTWVSHIAGDSLPPASPCQPLAFSTTSCFSRMCLSGWHHSP